MLTKFLTLICNLRSAFIFDKSLTFRSIQINFKQQRSPTVKVIECWMENILYMQLFHVTHLNRQIQETLQQKHFALGGFRKKHVETGIK